MTIKGPAGSWRAAASLFTIIPVGGPAEIERRASARIVLWLPVVGALIAVVAAGAMLAVESSGPGPARRLLGACLAVAIMGVLTGGLHLDGLADTADGLGSRQPADQALDIMRKSDIGPMGVSALLFALLLQVFALGVLPAGWRGGLALVAAAASGRVAVVLATGEPPARADGFGALIAGATLPRTRLAAAVGLFAAVAGVGAAVGGLPLAARAVGGVAAGLVAATLLQRGASRRLGGMTGDVFGALVEVCTTTVLVVYALHG
jgi:adenosylcobinamide-GDP ribazoletransferase